MITDYASLQAAIIDWSIRTGDTAFAAQVPTFIQLAEGEIATELRRRKIRKTVTFAAETYTLPSDCAELSSVRLASGSPSADFPFTIGTMESLNAAKTDFTTPGRPSHGAIVDKQLIMAPVPDQAYNAEIVYLQGLTPLATTPTNAYLTEYPNLYLYGALLQAAPYLERDERVPIWQSMYDSAITKFNAKREREELGASLRPVRPPVAF